ncbi:MAG: diacylglycerol kinase family lipid kinase [Planctomycetota bacterium]|nr:diacylglycerol kinase family lipid kinase [Planctomycetota bacterium]
MGKTTKHAKHLPSVPDIACLPSGAREVLISVNPQAGARSGRQLVEDLTPRLQSAGFTVQITSDIEQLSQWAAERLRNGSLRAVVAAGGDGTVALVVNRTNPGVPIVILPLGTENLLAKYLHVTAEPARICQIIREGAVVQLDAGQANDRIFLLMVGCGFDAEVVRRVHQARTGHIRRLTYAQPILASIRSYQYPELRIHCGQPESPIRAKWAFAFNLPRYAGGLGLAPWADGSDGLLDVCAFTRGSLWHGLRYLLGILLRRHRTWRDCVTLQTEWLKVASEAPVPYQLDGDFAGYLPVEIRVLPKRLTLLVPQGWRPGGSAWRP